MIAVLDYGIGNLASAQKALVHLGAKARLVQRCDDLTGASGVVLPGVGAFGACAAALTSSGLDIGARRALDQSIPFLGICVGFQLLFEGSEESPSATGLGVVSGSVQKMSGKEKLPQMQWNTVEPARRDSLMFPEQNTRPWFYFVHSFAPVLGGRDRDALVATCDYGGPVVAAIERENLWGVQFHPEKSGPDGLALLGRFIATCSASTKKIS